MVTAIRAIAVLALLASTYALVRTPFYIGVPMMLSAQWRLWSAFNYAIGSALSTLVLILFGRAHLRSGHTGIRVVATLTGFAYGLYLVNTLSQFVRPYAEETTFTYSLATLAYSTTIYLLEFSLATISLVSLRKMPSRPESAER